MPKTSKTFPFGRLSLVFGIFCVTGQMPTKWTSFPSFSSTSRSLLSSVCRARYVDLGATFHLVVPVISWIVHTHTHAHICICIYIYIHIVCAEQYTYKYTIFLQQQH